MIAFNLLRAAGALASHTHARATTATIRAQLINLPARIVKSAGLVAEVDRASADELRSRSNLVRVFVHEGLARREAGAQDKVESR